MASPLERLPFGHWSAIRVERALRLHAMVWSAGRAVETTAAYSFDGLARGRRPFAVLQVTLGGRGLVERDGRELQVAPGAAMLVFIPDAHRYRVDPQAGTWEFVYAVLYGGELLRVLRAVPGADHPVLAWHPGSPADAALYDLVETIRDARRASPFELSSRAYQLGMALHERVPDERGGRISRAKSFIENHLDTKLTMETLADVAGLTRHHFSREFARATGLPPVRYIREARCERAAALLSTTVLSVKEIADRCGFESSSYFCRVYRASTGMTPAGYRRSRP